MIRIDNTKEIRTVSEIAVNDSLRRESIVAMRAIITGIYEELGLDDEKLSYLFKTGARKSIYGRVPELISKVASIYAWPLDRSAGKPDKDEIEDKQEQIIDYLASKNIIVDHDLLMDIKEAKGFNSFITDEATVMEAAEPEYDDLKYYYITFASKANLPLVDYKLTPASWGKAENKALATISKEMAEIKAALEATQALEAA